MRATGTGSWPGGAGTTREALRVVRDVLGEHLPYLPELPGRGPGADMIGRTAGLIEGLPVDLTPSGWRLVDRPGRDLARARAWLRADLDDLAEAFDGWAGPLKLQVAGPLTLAASLWLPRGERALSDAGAVRDLSDALAEGLVAHLGAVARLLPGARLTVQIDEPCLPAVLAGAVPTLSGYGRLRPVEAGLAERRLGTVLDAAHTAVPGGVSSAVHCCAAQVPWALLRGAGAQAVAVDLSLVDDPGWEALASAVEGGLALWAGLTSGEDGRSPGEAARELLAPWQRLGLEPGRLADVVVTTRCGLAGVTLAQAVAAHRRLAQVAEELAEAAQG